MNSSPYVPAFLEQYLQLPPSHVKDVRQAFYNAAVFLFLSLLCMGLLAVYNILQVFLKPLMWAILCGIVLFPVKNKLTETIRGCIRRVDAEDQLLLVETAVAPFKILNAFSAILVHKTLIHSQLIKNFVLGFLFFHILAFFDFFWMPHRFSQLLVLIISATDHIFSIASLKLTLTIGVIYFLVFVSIRPNECSIMSFVSYMFWFSLLLWLCSCTGMLRIPILYICAASLLVGYLHSVEESENKERWASCNTFGVTSTEQMRSYSCDELPKKSIDVNNSSCSPTVLFPKSNSYQCIRKSLQYAARKGQRWSEFIKRTLLNVPSHFQSPFDPWNELKFFASPISTTQKEGHPKTDFYHLSPGPSTSFQPSKYFNQQKNRSFVNFCFMGLGWAHLIVILWFHHWPLYLVCLILLLLGLVRLSRLIRLPEIFNWFKCKFANLLFSNYFKLAISSEQKRAYWEFIMPKPFRGLLILFNYFDRKLRYCLDLWLDSVVSLFILILVIIGFCLLTLFLAFQIHNESIRLVSLTSDLINKALNSEVYGWLPKREQIDRMFGVVITNAYQAGRTWITDKTNELFEADPTNKALFKAQLLEIWENIYEKFVNQTVQGSVLNQPSNQIHPFGLFLNKTNVTHSSLLTFDLAYKMHSFRWNNTSIFNRYALGSLFTVIKQNLGILATITESVWSLMRSNLSLMAYLFTAMISLILSSGHVAINFIIAFLIFITVLFYLLSASGNCYIPVAFITSLTPTTSKASSLITHFYLAVESAISGVFVATLKLAIFYGLYTTLTHILFGLDLIVIPSVLAATFGAIPILGTYWAALPGAIEILLIRQSFTQAGLLIVFHIIPTYFVDVAIYREIKGAGHPYFTGLAIAGGIYYQGPEGAIIGPILLCCLLVAINLYRLVLESDKLSLNTNTDLLKSFYVSSVPMSSVHHRTYKTPQLKNRFMMNTKGSQRKPIQSNKTYMPSRRMQYNSPIYSFRHPMPETSDLYYDYQLIND